MTVAWRGLVVVTLMLAGCASMEPFDDMQADSLPRNYLGTQEYEVPEDARISVDFRVTEGKMDVFLIPSSQVTIFMDEQTFSHYERFVGRMTERFAWSDLFKAGNYALAYTCLGEDGCTFSFEFAIRAANSVAASPRLVSADVSLLPEYIYSEETDDVAAGYFLTLGFDVSAPTAISYEVELPVGSNVDVCIAREGGTEVWVNGGTITTWGCRHDTYLAAAQASLPAGTYELGIFCDQTDTCAVTYSLWGE